VKPVLSSVQGRALVLLAPLLVLAPALAGDTSVDDFIAKVKKGMSGIKTTRGHFKQTKKLAIFNDDVVSLGSFSIERPDRLRWEVRSPFRSVLVITGERGARWNENMKKVERFALADKPGIDIAVKQMFAWYSGRFDEIKAFEPTLEQDGRTIALVPRNEKLREVLSRITIHFAPTFATIESIVLEEKGGDRTDMAFEAIELDKELEAGTFDIPDGGPDKR
jgi:outer membrane lipoprotein-sorting protein